MSEVTLRLSSEVYKSLWDKDKKFHVLYGGRGSGKSVAIAQRVVTLALEEKCRILCCREIQKSIRESVHAMLCTVIEQMGVTHYFRITDNAIVCKTTGAEFIFSGLAHNINSLKSSANIKYVWIEEADTVSKYSWQVLIPTIRTPGAQFFISFNPHKEDDPVYRMFVASPEPREDASVTFVNWDQNSFFPDVLRVEMERDYRVSPEDANWIWGGQIRRISEALMFNPRRWSVENCDVVWEDATARKFFGLDFGWNDPTALTGSVVFGNTLFIVHEAWANKITLDEIPALLKKIPGIYEWPIYADNSRPDSIEYVRRKGFRCSAAEKGKGSVEDGLSYLKQFDQIVIHPRCVHTIEEFRNYSWKTDPKTQEILPIPEDRWNHCVAEGSKITTARGSVPIENVIAGDYVMTRDGFKLVLLAGVTDIDRECLEITTVSGKVIVTPEHEVWSHTRGMMVRADTIQNGEDLLCIQHRNTQENPGNSIQTKSISEEEENIYIDRCGRTIMGSYLKAGISTTSMETNTITDWRIFKPSIQRNTQKSIHFPKIECDKSDSILTASESSQSPGIKPRRDTKNMLRLEGWLIKGFSQFLNHAKTAASYFCQKLSGTVMNSVITAVSQLSEENRVSTMSRESVNSAEKPGCVINTPRQNAVPSRVVNICLSKERHRVYDLTVEDSHEFFAENILVSNCVDSLRYAHWTQIKGDAYAEYQNLAIADQQQCDVMNIIPPKINLIY